jgi:hypothetical protein
VQYQKKKAFLMAVLTAVLAANLAAKLAANLTVRMADLQLQRVEDSKVC